MRWILAVLALTVATGALAQPAPPPKLVWQRIPGLDDVRRVYPPDAWKKGISGGAMVGCDVGADGLLTHCKAFAEEPAGMGFGDAGVNLAAYFQLKPGGFEAALPVPGKIAIPMAFGAPGRAPAKLGFRLGDSAILLSNFDVPRDASATTRLGCLGAEPPHHCEMHFVSWAARPNAMAALVSTLKVGASKHGGDLLICWVRPDGGLTDCQASSPAAGVIAADLAPAFKAPPVAEDRTPVGAGPIMITLKWDDLNAAAQALAPGATTAAGR